jgi:cytochrome c nitrite reductase small subunit
MKGVPGAGAAMLILAGIFLGVVLYGGFAFSMKATDQARFCGNCHTMAEFVRTHQMSGHAKQACNECHLPAGGMGRYLFKARSGAGDVMVTAFGTVADVIHATENTKRVVNDNCRRCHSTTVMNVAIDAKPSCTDCHRNTPHMSKIPISMRSAANE